VCGQFHPLVSLHQRSEPFDMMLGGPRNPEQARIFQRTPAVQPLASHFTDVSRQTGRWC